MKDEIEMFGKRLIGKLPPLERDYKHYYIIRGEGMERLTMTSDKGGVALTFDLDVTCNKSEMLKILKLAERLKHYEDLEEQGKVLIVPEIPKNKTLYWIWGDKIMPVTYKRITSCVVDDDGKPHIMCEMVTKKDRTFVETYRRKPIEHTFKKGDKRYFYADEIGKTVFLKQDQAEEALKGMKGDGKI